MRYTKLGGNGPEVSIVCLVSLPDRQYRRAMAPRRCPCRRRRRCRHSRRPVVQLQHTPAPPSSIDQGTMTWGEQNTEEEAWQQLDYALDHGVNFIDTGATDHLLLAVGGCQPLGVGRQGTPTGAASVVHYELAS